jgi:hypothetical protein
MESALKKEYAPVKSRTVAPYRSTAQIVTSDKFRSNIQQISDIQRKRDLIFALQELLAKLNYGGLTQYEFAYNAQHFFEELIFAETGLQSIRQGLRSFIDRLYAEPVITKLIHFVFKEMQKILNSKNAGQMMLDSSRILNAMQEVLGWYVERSANIDDVLFDESPAANYDQIFNLKVFHDNKHHGFMGMEVLAGLVLYGRAGQNLWLKVFVKESGEYILPHVDWNSWIDDTEIFTMKPVDKDVALSGIIPVSPQTQRLMIDRLRVFIPYSSLDLSPGKHEVEVECCLFNEKGDRLLSASSAEVLSVARNYKITKSLISEQAIGIWAKDYVSGDGIDDLEVVCLQQPNGDWLGDLIKITFDFEIYDKLGQSLFVEVRFYNSHGALVKTSNSQEKDQYMAMRSEVYIDEIIFKRYALELVVPRIQLNIDDDDRNLSCEVCLLSNENKVLCGMLHNFTLPEQLAADQKGPPVEIELKDTEVKTQKKGIFGRLKDRLRMSRSLNLSAT